MMLTNVLNYFLLLSLLLPIQVSQKGRLRSLSTVASTDSHAWIIQYGWDESGQLKYVAFTGMKKGQRFTGIVTTGSDETFLTKPGGEKVILPTAYQLYQYVDGKFAQRKGTITIDELRAFLKSKPKEYTIDELLNFAKTHNKQRKR